VYRLLALSLALLAPAASLDAHHSFAAEYFEERTVTIEGAVVAFEFVFPHVSLHLNVPDENGRLQKFSVEWSNPGRLKQAGFSATSFKVGDRLIITGSPHRNPEEHKLHLRTIRRPSDGWRWPKSGRDDEL
jgi:uncharacterized protein DUF6152